MASKTLREFLGDDCLQLAAGLTYYLVLALFPALLAILSILGLVGQSQQTVETVTGIITDLGGGTIAQTLTPTLTELAQNSTAGLAFIIGLLVALWSASGYVVAFGKAMNRIYEKDEGRPVWKLRPVMLLVTLGAVILVVIAALILVVSGPVAQAIGDAIGIGSTAILVWQIAKWPILLVIAIVLVALLYHATPNVRQPRMKWISLGSVFAIVVWVLASAAFAFYIANFSNYAKTYGSLAGVIIFLLWLWITNIALLLGAELNAEIERGRQLQGGIRAEEDIQLPPRDTTTLDKAEKKNAKDTRRARALRKSRGKNAQPTRNA
ncbi:YihY/virulence factor BrkB family protein [Brevibacterium casei]|uniref:YihY/virulence factor BrkB family protein n=1 Tax=Brevibacterium casei TaxID=33889 RepID=UPI001E2BC8BC|nr:YihY/virulence factor BrkB family protein [Brevibacterium casei]